MKHSLSFIAMATLLSACGGGGDSSSSGETLSSGQVTDCQISNDELTLGSGESCSLSSADAATYSQTAGTISCENGTLTIGSSSFSGTPTVLNGLTYNCAS